MSGCMSSSPDTSIVDGSDFDPGSRTLFIDRGQSQDTSLRQVIALSGIRTSGYGLLVNVDSSASLSFLESLRDRFKKLDINAVHILPVNGDGLADNKTAAAVAGARFTWVFSDDPQWPGGPGGSPLQKALDRSLRSGGILVVRR